MSEHSPETILYMRPITKRKHKWQKIAKHSLDLVTLPKGSKGFDFATRIEMKFYKSLLVEEQYTIVNRYIISEKTLTIAEAQQIKKALNPREHSADENLDMNLDFTIRYAQQFGEIIYYNNGFYNTTSPDNILIPATAVAWEE